MRILFFDLEYASCKNGCKICEFGYVITNEKFEIIERNNIIINPNITFDEWDLWALKHILTRTRNEYEERLSFDKYYPKIKGIIESCDFVLGHSLNNDAKALNDDCKRYNLPSIDFDFYDVKLFYKEYKNTKKEISVMNILNELNVQGQENEHDAKTDAYNTMIEFKEILNKLECNVEDMIALCPNVKDKTENYIVKSIENAKKEKELKGGNYRQFSKKLKEIAEKYPERNEWPAICLSDTIVETNYNYRLNFIKLLFDKKYNYTVKVSECSYFVVGKGYGERDLSCDYNIEDKSKDIKKISISELSKMLDTDITENCEVKEKTQNDSKKNENYAIYLALKESLNKKGSSYEEFLKKFDN